MKAKTPVVCSDVVYALGTGSTSIGVHPLMCKLVNYFCTKLHKFGQINLSIEASEARHRVQDTILYPGQCCHPLMTPIIREQSTQAQDFLHN